MARSFVFSRLVLVLSSSLRVFHCRLAHEPSCALFLLDDGGEEALDLAHKLTCFAAHERLRAAQALSHPFFGRRRS